MKKFVLCFACMALVFSCGFNIPETLTIKASPELYLSLGNPLSGDNSLVDYISPEKIKQMMSDATADTEMEIYEYSGTLDGVGADVQTYMLHYPIVSMQLDLQDYVATAMEAAFPDVTFPIAFIEVNGNKLPRIPLKDMSMLVEEIKGSKFGISIDKGFEDKIKVCIPAFGIGTIPDGNPASYEWGVVNGDNLEFVNDADIYPIRDFQDGLEIFFYFAESCAGYLTVELIFEWDSATINTTGEELSGTYPIMYDLGEFLGEEVLFNKVLGLIYVDGIGATTDAEMTLLAGTENLHETNGKFKLKEAALPQFDKQSPFPGPIPEDSLGGGIDLTDILNSSEVTDINYSIEINSLTINKGDVADKTITADLLILLPLELKVTTPSGYSNEYVKLDFGSAFDISGGAGNDMFGRDDGGSGFFSYVKDVKIYFKNIKSNIIDLEDLAIYVTNSDGTEIDLVELGANNPVLTIKDDIINPDIFVPFSPQFEVLLKKDDGENFGTFSIKRLPAGKKAEFSFTLAVSGKLSIDETINL